MNVSSEALDKWALAAWEARHHALAASSAAARGDKNGAQRQAGIAAEAARVLALDMERMGAERPKQLPQPLTVPLEMLSTPLSRQYAEAMRRAYELAREVDHERGYGDDGPADLLEGFALDAEQEAFGAVGKVRE